MRDALGSRSGRKHPGPVLCWAMAGAMTFGGGGFIPARRPGPESGIPPPAPLHEAPAAKPPTEYPSRGASSPLRGLTVLATGYCACPLCCGRSADGITSTGMKARPGVIAVDPDFIPLYTRLYIEGYGDAIAGDTGSKIRGPHVDLFFDTHQEAAEFGRRWVTAYILPAGN